METTHITDVENFADLFAGSREAYGTDAGGCDRPVDDGDWNPGSIASIYGCHLHEQGQPIGVYPMLRRTYDITPVDGYAPHHVVKWGCVDIDIITKDKPGGDVDSEQDAHTMAVNIQTALRLEGITSWIEITKSRGRHVWVFAEDWVPAATMRRALIVSCRMANASEREVNPKQETLEEGQLGNYVRLPYPGKDIPHSLEPAIRYTRVVVDAEGAKMTLSAFLSHAMAQRTPSGLLEALAALYVPPAPPIHVTGDVPDLDRDLTSRLGGLAWTIFCNGPLDGKDRSSTLMRLSHLCREDKLTPNEAIAVISAADIAWGKFSTRADGYKRLTAMVEKAYAGWEEV